MLEEFGSSPSKTCGGTQDQLEPVLGSGSMVPRREGTEGLHVACDEKET